MASQDHKRRCEKQAHEIVQDLIVNPISKDFFVNSLKRLSPQHYEDITVERSLSNLCGYCLCEKELPSVPQQKYKIVKNRVYDLSIRKRFCSDRCYANSCKILEQIPSTPLWLRSDDDTKVDVIFDYSTALLGDEVIVKPRISKSDVDYKAKTGSPVGGDDDECVDDMLHIEPISPPCITANVVSVPPNHRHVAENFYNEMILIEGRNVLSQWITQGTSELLFEDSALLAGELSSMHMNEKELMQTPHLQEVSKSHVQTTPPNHALSCDINYYEDKVSTFFGGGLAPPTNKNSTESQEQFPISMISSHQSEARHIRENIVIKQLRILVDDLSPPLPNILPELRAFVKTLNLTKSNVLPRIELWPMLTISILYLLSLNNPALENVFNSQQFCSVLHNILKACGTNFTSVKHTVFELPVLQKYRSLARCKFTEVPSD